jgi:hypothetical protein
MTEVAPAKVVERSERRRLMSEQRDASKKMKAEGLPKSHRVGRIVVQLNNCSPGVLRECPHCGRENWKWVATCIGCKQGLA